MDLFANIKRADTESDGIRRAWVVFPVLAKIDGAYSPEMTGEIDGADEGEELGDNDMDGSGNDNFEDPLNAMFESMSENMAATMRAAGFALPESDDGNSTDDSEAESRAAGLAAFQERRRRRQDLELPVDFREGMSAKDLKRCVKALERLLRDEAGLWERCKVAIESEFGESRQEFLEPGTSLEGTMTVEGGLIGLDEQKQCVVAMTCSADWEPEHGIGIRLRGDEITVGYVDMTFDIMEDHEEAHLDPAVAQYMTVLEKGQKYAALIPDFPRPDPGGMAMSSASLALSGGHMVVMLEGALRDLELAKSLLGNDPWGAVRDVLSYWEKRLRNTSSGNGLHIIPRLRSHLDGRFGRDLVGDGERESKPIPTGMLPCKTPESYATLSGLGKSIRDVLIATEIMHHESPREAATYLCGKSATWQMALTGHPDPSTEIGAVSIRVQGLSEELLRLGVMPSLPR